MDRIIVSPTAIDGVLIIEPQRFGDERGWFSETFRAETLARWGVDRPFVQDNHAFTLGRAVLRGLHFQSLPMAQAKLVRVTQGTILDVAVDLRRASPQFGLHVAVELGAANGRQLYVPRGFAHGYVTLSEKTEVLYKVDEYFALEFEQGLAWNDPELGIEWPSPSSIKTNNRDALWPNLSALATSF